jgi:2'-5' RNA ligase
MGGGTRAFLALALPEEALVSAARARRGLRDRVGDRDVRWVEPRNLHVTLRFFGDLDAARLTRARELARGLADDFDALATAWSGLGAFPSPRRVQVIWLALRDERGEIAALAGRVNRRLEESGFGRPDKPFRSHVTLGRVRRGARVSFEQMSQDLTTDDHAFSISSIVLMKSTLTPQGPVYTPLETAKARSTDPHRQREPKGKESHDG